MTFDPIPEDRYAGDGYLWRCGVCGKVAEDQLGFLGFHSYDWDESCILNCGKVLISKVPRGWLPQGFIPRGKKHGSNDL